MPFFGKNWDGPFLSSLFLLMDYLMIRTEGLALCNTNWEVLPKKSSLAELRPLEPITTISILFREEFANLASSLILAGAVSANPILLIVSIVSWAKSYTKDKNKKAFKKGTIEGLLGMGSFIMTASLFASPLLGIIIGLVVLIVIKKQLKNTY